jgi:plasmid stabilization system protein ParE
MSYRIKPSAQAEAEIDRIFHWLSQRSPEGAARWYESFWDATERKIRQGGHLLAV